MVKPNASTTDPTESAHLMSDQVAARAHEVVDRAAVTAREVETRAREAASHSMEKLGASQEQAKRQVGETFNKLTTFIREEPVAAAGVAFAAGLFAAALLRR